LTIWKKLRNEFIDIIEWVDDTNDTIVYKFPRYQNEIKNGAKLTVRESQTAVLINEGKIADVYKPGMHSLSTANMPILSTLMGWKYAFNSPFKADVFFVSTKRFTDQKWGTKNAFTVSDERFGMIEIRAFGNFGYRIVDAALFLREIAGTDQRFTTEEINGQLRSLIITAFSQSFGKSGITIDMLVNNLMELGNLCKDKLNEKFSEYGITITDFNIENASMPDELKKEIFEYSRLGKVNAQELAQFKMAKSIETAAANEGLGGAGVGMGVGMGMGQIMGGMVSNMASQMAQPVQQNPIGGQGAAPNASAPPPIDSYFIVLNGQQAGPFDLNQLAQMAVQGNFNQSTLVWKQGMSNWQAASAIGALNGLFSGNTPPPVPPPLP
jgi:membrane protease subunit (stomatin/prohibitin family)